MSCFCMNGALGWVSTCETSTLLVLKSMLIQVFSWAYFMGAWVGPIVSGTVADHIGWRWFFWISTILQGVRDIPQSLCPCN